MVVFLILEIFISNGNIHTWSSLTELINNFLMIVKYFSSLRDFFNNINNKNNFFNSQSDLKILDFFYFVLSDIEMKTIPS